MNEMENNDNAVVKINDEEQFETGIISVTDTGEIKDNFVDKFKAIFEKYDITVAQTEYIKLRVLNRQMPIQEIATKVGRNRSYLSQFYNKWNAKNAMNEIIASMDNEAYMSTLPEIKNLCLQSARDILTDKTEKTENKIKLIAIMCQQTKETKQDISVTNKIELPF